MSGSVFDDHDIRAFAQILEHEHKSHCRKRAVCFWLFAFWFVLLIAALGLAAFIVLRAENDGQNLGQTVGLLQVLGLLSAAVVTFFTMGWATQNCIHSIERSLFAFRAGRHQLFQSLLEQVQCADKEKRRLWLEVAKALLS